jgi:hypothetical protein
MAEYADQRAHDVNWQTADERERAQERVNLLDWMVAWEEGALSAEGEIALFQRLVDNGMAWTLQGMYGRQAAAMLEAGLIHTGD